MARHAKKSDRSMAIRTYLTAGLTAGVTGAALAGVGTLLLADGDVSGPAQIEVQLVSNEEDILWLSLNGGSDRRSAAQSAVVQQSSANPALRPMIGDGGWLIGNGLDAADDCQGDACNGGDGGILWGNGGNGAHGGTGGDGGFWFGHGGNGGDGDAVLDARQRRARRA
ncbi:hypothetical protein H7I42_21900, partial [Mycolicibacterium vanbaalenii PYR-1]|nr:hypothetical protein [Mycolicibacterium vanbaalenii PYR-1]